MDFSILPARNNQDYAGVGRIHNTDYIFAFDGHGTHHVIDQIRNMNMDDIASASNPVFAVHERLQGDSYRSGSTMAFARKTGNLIETFNCGDSALHVYVNGMLRHVSTAHTFTNPVEIKRTESMVHFIKPTMAPFPVSDTTIHEILSPEGHFKTGEALVPSQSLGHNNMTGLEPELFTLTVKPTDHVRMIVGSDGFWDMRVNPSGNAQTLTQEALRRWKQEWDYPYLGRIVKNRFEDRDDICVAVYDDVIKTRPSLCIPWSPLHFTTEQVHNTFEAIMNGVLRVDELIKPTHKIFFIHFLPHSMDDRNTYVYDTLKERRIKVYYSNDWFWMVGMSHFTEPLRCVDDTYSRWKGENYTEFMNEQISSFTCYKIQKYLECF